MLKTDFLSEIESGEKTKHGSGSGIGGERAGSDEGSDVEATEESEEEVKLPVRGKAGQARLPVGVYHAEKSEYWEGEAFFTADIWKYDECHPQIGVWQPAVRC